jgi:glycosyltransferase involved in cell wall biosynthesis
MPNSNEKLRFAYISGPVDAVSVFKRWQSESRASDYFGTIYLEQFFDVCRDLDAELYVVTTLPRRNEVFHQDWCTVQNHPTPDDSSGIAYHIKSIWWFLSLVPPLVRFKPDIVVLTAMQNYWFVACILRLFGIRLVSSLHCTLWPRFSGRRRSVGVLLWLNNVYYRWAADGFIAVSTDIKEQLISEYDVHPAKVSVFLPTYDRQSFESYAPKPHGEHPFTVLYCGRIEENKGVFDLLAVCSRLKEEDRLDFRLHFCGEGSQLDLLRRRIQEEHLDASVFAHGQCGVEELSRIIRESHIFVVPTRSSFEEGFNKVCAESVLSLRPLITSKVCPALQNVRGSAIEVRPDNLDDYHDAIVSLARDPGLYNEKAEHCRSDREQFFDQSQSYGARIKKLLTGSAKVREERSRRHKSGQPGM